MLDGKSYVHSKTFRRISDTFCVEVVHWTSQGGIDTFGNFDMTFVKNNWNVYVVVSQTHIWFDDMTDEYSDCPHLEDLHWGATYEHIDRDETGKAITKKYGSDYMHLHDDEYETYNTPEQAYRVFRDADKLFDTFKEAEDTKKQELTKAGKK